MDRLTIKRGDITTVAVDAIVNAANERCLGGGGVDGAIHRAAGPKLKKACMKLPEIVSGVRCPTGEAQITDGFALPAKHVIHVTGPVYGKVGGKEAELLASCYLNALRLADEHGVETIAFPSISTGVYGYPLEEAANVAAGTVREYFAENPDSCIEEVIFIAFSDEAEVALKKNI